MYAVMGCQAALIAGYGGVYSWIWVPVEIIAFAALLAVLVLHARRQELPPLNWLLLPALAFGVLVLSQWLIPTSIYPAATLTAILQLALCGTIFYLALSAFRSVTNLRKAGTLLWGLTGLIAAEAILQYGLANQQIYWIHDASYASPMGPFVYHNYYAGLMDLLIPVAVAVSFRPGTHHRIPTAQWLRRGIIPGLALLSVVLSRSRGGLAVLFLEATLAFLVLLPKMRKNQPLRRAIVVIVMILASFAAVSQWGPITKRFKSLNDHDVSTFQRIEVAKACLNIWKSHPWIGTGWGTFPTIYPQFQLFDTGQQWLAAHDDYAQTLAETGIAGASLVILFLAIYLVMAYRRSSMPLPNEISSIRQAAFIGTLGFLVHAAGDFEFHSPANACLFFMMCALSVTNVASSSSPRRPHLPQDEDPMFKQIISPDDLYER